MEILGYHAYWSAPRAARNLAPGLSPFTILCQMISAELWQRHHRWIRLYTDPETERLLGRLGLLDFYDTIDTRVVTSMIGEIDPATFWAAPKLYALRSCPLPCCSVDGDLLLFRPLQPDPTRSAEGLHDDPPYWSMYRDNWKYRRFGFEDWRLFERKPINIALLHVQDESFRKFYTETSIDFMRRFSRYLAESGRGNRSHRPLNAAHTMMFASQRLVSACGTRLKVPTGVFESIPKGRLYCQNERVFHLWSLKSACEEHAATRERYVNYLLKLAREHELTRTIQSIERLGLEEKLRENIELHLPV